MSERTAIVLGATGLTGGLLVDRLIADDRYSKIKLFSRKASKVSSPKIEEFLGDLLQLETFESDFTGDVIFCCIGTTKAKTKDQAKYKEIDYGIPVAAAKLAKKNGIHTIIVISSLGADAESQIFYSRTKGEMERDVIAQEITHTHILQPSLILGKRKERRLMEKIGAGFFKLLGFLMVGPLVKYKAIEADAIAAGMINIDKSKPDLQIIESDKILKFAQMK